VARSKEFDHGGLKRLVIVSNRLPVALAKREDGSWEIRRSTGGLVTALAPIFRRMGGLWIGWSGTFEDVNLDELMPLNDKDISQVSFRAVPLTEEEVNQYYLGFSNETIWPLFHDMHSRCKFEPESWHIYQEVNRKFAHAVEKSSDENDCIWVHDYHLMLVARELRAMNVKRRVVFFLHTPFPPLDIFIKLPWRVQVIRALLEYDLVGFQTMRDRNNFIDCVEHFSSGSHLDARRRVAVITTPQREIRTGIFPISIDFDEFSLQAGDEAVTEKVVQMHQSMPGCQVILGVDRLDYSKGIPLRLRAFKNALERFSDLRRRVTLVEIVVPSRENIQEYQKLKANIEGLVSEINGEFAEVGWNPVQYMFRAQERIDLLAYYRAASIALITPLKDGMNLVAKEYCAANIEENGVLILSEFAGAAIQLHRNPLLVNPYDIEGVSSAIYRAYNMDMDERKARMRRLRNAIRRRDIFWWVDSFLNTVAMCKQRDTTTQP